MFSRMSMKLKLMLSVSIIVIIMMSISVFISTQISYNTIYQRILTNEAPASVNYIAETFESKIGKAISISKLIADNPFLLSWLKNGEPETSKNDAIGFLQEVKKQEADFVFMVTAEAKKYYTHEGLFKEVSVDNARDGWFLAH